jgi:hypothetical protein
MPRVADRPSLSLRPFRVSEAVAAGIPRSRLTRADLSAPIHGVRAPADQPISRVEAVALVLRPDQFFSHLTAARLWGAPLPGPIDDELVHVTSANGSPIMRRPQVVPHRSRSSVSDIRVHRGLRISDPSRSWYECAGIVSFEDLVVVGDYFVGPSGLATIDDLASAIPPGGRHARAARAALELIRPGVESPMESRMRLRLVQAGFPEPSVNVDVSAPDGTFLGRVDLAWPEHRIAFEYDGDHHRERSTFHHDQRRSNGFSVHGWIVVHATALDAARPALVFERLRQAFEQRRLERGA